MNTSKLKTLLFSAKRSVNFHPSLLFDNQIIVDSHTQLGVTLSKTLSWRTHILNVHQKASRRLNLLKGLKFKVDRSTLDTLYIQVVSSSSYGIRRRSMGWLYSRGSIAHWSNKYIVTMNTSKLKTLLFSAKRSVNFHPSLLFDNQIIVDSHTQLGVTLSKTLSWRTHILNVHQKASRRLNLLKGLKFKVDRSTLDTLYIQVVSSSSYGYADAVWGGCTAGGPNY